MVGLADLKKHFENVKKCNMTLSDKYCYFSLSGVNTIDFLDIVNYKSWVYKSFQKMVNIRYVYIIKKLEKGITIVRTSVGFAPLLLRFLRIKGYQVREEDIEVFRARNIVFPDFKIQLYDFQERMINDWSAAGSIGVLKSPTGSGKCAAKGTLILTRNGLIKIEDIVKKISDSKREDKDNCQQTLYDTIGIENNEEGFLDDENVKNVNSIVSISPKLKYESYDILARYNNGVSNTITIETSIGFGITATPEHKIIVIDEDGNLRFKRLDNITKDDYVAITYNTNTFNERLKLNYCFRPSKYDSNSRFMTNIGYMNESIARLLGYAISEGTDYGNRDNNITSFDKEMVDDMICIIRCIGLEPKYVYREDKNDGDPIGIDIYSKSLREFFYYLGYRHGSRNKEIPWSILQADRSSQIAFIRALFDGDGTLYHKDEEEREEGGKYAEFVGYTSSSYELCRQLQIILLNMGIISRLKRKKGVTLEYRGELRQYDESYILLITGGQILKFAEIIGFGLRRKQEKLDKIVRTLNSRERWTNIVYPNVAKKLNVLYERLKTLGSKGKINKIWVEDFDFNGKVIKLTRKKKLSHFQYLEECRFRREMLKYIKGEMFPSKITLDKILKILNPDMLDSNDSVEKSNEYQIYLYLKKISDMFIFDKVEKIKEGKELVYDITVDNVHSYIGNGIINHNTIIGCNAIKKIGRKTLILVHTSDLLINVWNDSLIKSFGPGIMGQVGIIGGGLTDRDRAALRLGVRSGDFNENIRKDIVIATFQTLMNRIDELTQYKFGLMMVDECHHCPAQMFRKVNAVIRAPYKLGLSATIERLDGMTRDVFGQLGSVQSKVSIRELINRGILAEPRFQSPVIVDNDVMNSIQDSGLSGLNYSRLVKKKSAASQKKKDFVVNICKNIAARDRKFLLFTDYVNAEDVFVRDMYADSLLKEGTSVSVIDQGMASDERGEVFNFLENGDISGIVFGKLGSEGVNIPSVDVVVMANAVKSPITFTQRVGRAMRRIPGKDWCDVYEVLLDLPTEMKWSHYNFAEYSAEGFQKLTYKVE
jgi:superfamily II DNA or RNA helicase/intein/homing endonuclease